MSASTFENVRAALGEHGRRATAWASKSQERHGKTLLYVIGNFARWVFIALMFVFLLSMVIVLSEVMSFQNRVVSLIGDKDQARSVVLMLHKIYENEALYTDSDQLPYAALAVRLDRVASARRELERFSDFLSTSGFDNGAASPEGDGAPADGTASDASDAADPEVGPTMAAADAGDAPVNGTSARPAPSQATSRPTTAGREPLPVTDELRKEFAEHRAQLSTSIADLDNLLNEQDPQIPLIRAMNAVEATLAELERYDLSDTEPAPASTASGMLSPAASYAEQSQKLIDDLVALEIALAKDPLNVEQVDAFDAVKKAHEDFHALRLKDDFVVALAANGPDPAAEKAEPPTDPRGLLGSVGTSRQHLEEALSARYGPDYAAAREVAAHINALRDSAARFEEFEPQRYAPAEGDPDLGERAQERYSEALAGMTRSFNDMETSLGRHTKVVTVANVIRANAGEGGEGAAAKAETIINDFESLDRFLFVMQPFAWLSWSSDADVAGIDIHPQRLATLSTDSLTTIYIFMIGAIGSLLFIAKYYMGMALQGHWLRKRPTRPMSWLIFRPFFGVVVAFALYLVVRAGQLAFGVDGDGGFGTDLNLPIISVVALFAGLLSWQALEAIETRGSAWFGARTREPLYAGGLGNALRAADHSITECAHQVGRSVEQVERWLLFRDRVTVEMQDRIATWLERSANELFSDRKPADELGGQPLWATGLKKAMEDRERRLDVKGLAELLREDDVERIAKWIALKLQVTPPMQWRLVDALDVPHHKLFDRHIEDREAWAVRLREAMADRKLRTSTLAEKIGFKDLERLYAWKELEQFVPIRFQDDLVEALDCSHNDLFDLEAPRDEWFLWAHGLPQAMQAKGMGPDDLAHEVDVEPERVRDWIARRKRVAPATRKRIVAVLGIDDESEIFKSYREHIASGPQPEPDDTAAGPTEGGAAAGSDAPEGPEEAPPGKRGGPGGSGPA